MDYYKYIEVGSVDVTDLDEPLVTSNWHNDFDLHFPIEQARTVAAGVTLSLYRITMADKPGDTDCTRLTSQEVELIIPNWLNISNKGAPTTKDLLKCDAITQYIPPFHPTVGAIGSGSGGGNDRSVSFYEGYIKGPREVESTVIHEIVSNRSYPFKPKIGAKFIDDAVPPELNLDAGSTNWVYFDIRLVKHTTLIGNTTDAGGSKGFNTIVEAATTGITVDTIANHDHVVLGVGSSAGDDTSLDGEVTPTITDPGHPHDAVGRLADITTHINESPWPLMAVQTGATFTSEDTELGFFVPCFKWVLDAAGVITTYERYLAENYTLGTTPTYVAGADGPDIGYNPKIQTDP